MVKENFKLEAITGFRAVVAHHPFWLPDDGDLTRLVERKQFAFDYFKKAGVRLLLTGHEHTSVVKEIDLEGHSLMMSQAPSPLTNRLRGEPNGYHIIDIKGTDLSFRRCSWQDDGFKLEPHAPKVLRQTREEAA